MMKHKKSGQEGQGAVEYVLVLVLVAILVIAVISLLHSQNAARHAQDIEFSAPALDFSRPEVEVEISSDTSSNEVATDAVYDFSQELAALALYEYEIALAESDLQEISVMQASAADLGVGPKGIDWDRFKDHPHIRARHEPIVAACIAHIAKTLKFGQVLRSHDGVIADKFTGENTIPAVVYVRDLGQAIRALSALNMLGGCAGLDMEALAREFGIGNKFAPEDFYAIAVFGLVTRMDGSTTIFPKTMYLVPKTHWDAFQRCDWHLTIQMYPVPATLPCP